MKTITATVAAALAMTGMIAPTTPAFADSENSAQILKGAGCRIAVRTPEGIVRGAAPDSFMRVITKSGNITAICRLEQDAGPELTRAYTFRNGFCRTGAGNTNDVKIVVNPSGMMMLVCKIKGNG